jgi:hypothetical protein
MEILQQDLVDPDFSNSDVRSWLKEEPEVLKLVKNQLQSSNPSNDYDAQDARVNHHHHHLSASIWFVLQNLLYPDKN